MIYRDRIDVISQILDTANGGGATRSKIAYNAFLNYNQLKENLTALTEKDLLRYYKLTRTFKTPEKGLRSLHVYNQMHGMIKTPLTPEQQQI